MILDPKWWKKLKVQKINSKVLCELLMMVTKKGPKNATSKNDFKTSLGAINVHWEWTRPHRKPRVGGWSNGSFNFVNSKFNTKQDSLLPNMVLIVVHSHYIKSKEQFTFENSEL